MPIYEYRCSACRNTFELRRSYEDDTIAACPDCQGPSERLFSAVPIFFKGSGFYMTDYRDRCNRKDSTGEESTNTSKESCQKKEEVSGAMCK